MGRRKERRNAAMGATGRRVKLDLFAEPSGDQDEANIGEGDSKNHAGILPNSPSSSSGQNPQNPLLLLGQYSDDESDEEEESKEQISSDDTKSPLGNTEEQVKEEAVIDDKNADVNKENDSVMQKVEQFILEMDSELPDSSEKLTEDGKKNKDTDLTEQITHVTSDKQENSEWKMVLHEESNQYYYWNIVTGETSWGVPHVSDQETEIKDATHSVEQNDHENFALDEKIEGNETLLPKLPDLPELPELPDDALVSNESKFIEDSLVICEVDTIQQHKEDESGIEFSSRLIEHCENLLEQMKCINRSKDDVISKCKTEIEIRMNDIKSLASHGSLILPFWVYSEKQLKNLEEIINNQVKEVEMNEIKDTLEPGEIVSEEEEEEKPVGPINGAIIEETVKKVEGLASQIEDTDMDVDMEVEDKEWVPPPPPDNEPYPPPPPPNEPPETPNPPPPGSDTVQNFSYTEQYNQTYPLNYDYYGFQGAVTHPSVYYEAVPTIYSAGPVMVNPIIDHTAYYNNTLQEGLVDPTSGISSVSGFKSFNSDTLKSIHTQSKANNDVSETNGEIEKASTSVTDTVTTIKPQTKVARTKKRTVSVASTLRSNKKVSSLVDKWKAAKEEMHEEEEEEAETYLEKLEKKRQREIEQWRAQQIASGEANENANFQPLGGDWRERVKRKRSELKKEKEKEEISEKPDMNQLSKGLPSNWKVYWDDSSKQVYYGNTKTSETSWTRPTK